VAEIVDVPAERRYLLTVEGRPVGRLDYDVTGDVFVAAHIVVDRSHEGQGLGGTLVRHVLDEVRSSRRRLRPRCPFVAHFVRQNPEYADLLEDARPAANGVS